MLALVHENTEFVLDLFWNVRSVKLCVHESRQTMIELLCMTDNVCSGIQHSLQPVCYIPWRSSKDSITVIHAGHHKSMDECCSRFGVK